MTPSRTPIVVRLVPDERGGIGRLFSYLEAAGAGGPPVETFETHGGGVASLARLPLRLARFARLLRTRRVGLVHINLASRGSTYRKALFAAVCRAAGVPYLIHLHGGGYREFHAGASRPVRAAIRRLFSGAALVVTLGRVWQDYVCETFRLPRDRVVILPNGVAGPEEVDWAAKARPPHLLFLGLMAPEKGVPELVAALGSPRLSSLAWTATLAGNGDVERFRAEVAAAGLADRVAVPGWAGPQEVRALLARSSVLILPSHIENLPLSILEGMAFGLCPVATPVGAIPEVIAHGRDGLLTPVGDSSALAEVLARLVSDPAELSRLSIAARATYEERYRLALMKSRLDALYAGLLAEPRTAAHSPAGPQLRALTD